MGPEHLHGSGQTFLHRHRPQKYPAFQRTTGEHAQNYNRLQHVSPLFGRFVPFAAVAAANCINIPLMRQRELKHGIPTTDENDNRLGESTKAAQQAISQVVVSRILMVSPGMAIPPFLMNHFPKEGIFEEVPMDECTHSSGPGGILLGVRHSPLLCTLSTKEFHVGEPVGAGAAGEDPGESPGSGESVLQQGAIEERQPPSPS